MRGRRWQRDAARPRVDFVDLPFSCPKLPCKLEGVAPFSVACFFSHGFGVGPAEPESVKTLKDFLAWAKTNVCFLLPAPEKLA